MPASLTAMLRIHRSICACQLCCYRVRYVLKLDDVQGGQLVEYFHVHNAGILKWWQKHGLKRCPNLRLYRDVSNIPASMLDASASGA